MVAVFFINLPSEKKRRYDNYDDSMTLVKATTREEVPKDIKTKMVSYHNISPSNHLGKCACFLSHYKLLVQISKSFHKGCVILEDDAVGKIDYDVLKTLPQDSITYLGGFFAPKKITDTGKEDEVEGEEVYSSQEGLNELPEDRKLLMTVAYYIPNNKVAKEIVDYIDSKDRYRAIDVMLNNWEKKKYYWFPAMYKEGDYQSGIREKKTKHSTLDYKWV
jgi:GR25 family glycosyltransferase involved in LPS biosynthesis